MKKIEFTPHLACAYAEGFCEGKNATAIEQIEAFAYIAKTKLYRSLQGWYGRTLKILVDKGIMDFDGNINQERINDLSAS